MIFNDIKSKFKFYDRNVVKLDNLFLVKFIILSLLWIGTWYPQFTLAPSEFPDSPGYVSTQKQLDGYFSLTGYSLRAWPTVLIFWLGDNNWQRTAIQTGIYALSWTLFLLAWLRGKNQGQSIIIGGLLLVFALSPRVLQWNTFLLSESLSVSLVLLGAAMFKFASENFFREITQNNFLLIILGTIFFSLAAVNRASLLPLLLIAPLITLIILIKSKNQKLLKFFGFTFSLAAILYPISYNSQTNFYWSSENTRLSRSSFYFIYNTIYESLQPEWGNMLWENIENQAPKCLEEYRASGIDPYRNPYYVADLMASNCPQAVNWLNQNFDSAYLKFFITHPVPAVGYAIEMIGMVQDPVPYPSNSIVPNSLSSIFESKADGSYSFKPIYAWLVLGPLALFNLLIFRIRPSSSTFLATLLYLTSLGSVIVTQFVIVSEPVRITTPATALLIPSCVLLIAESLNQILNKKT